MDLLDEEGNEATFSLALNISVRHFPSAGHQRVEAVLDHVFSALADKLVGDARPFPTLLQDGLQNDEVLLNSPLSLLNSFVHMVEPVLAALFGRFEALPVGVKENTLGNGSPTPVEVAPGSREVYLIES